MRLLCLVVALATVSATAADVIHVPADAPTIQDAIDAANPGDEVIVAAGTYREVINLLGKAISLRSSTGPAFTTIDGTGLNQSVVTATSGETSLTLVEGFTITGGTNLPYGGGMRIVSSSPTLRDLIFLENYASFGGGLSAEKSHSRLDSCIFERNQSSVGGGLQATKSPLQLERCTFDANFASSNGGGIHSYGSSPTIRECTFVRNKSGIGGAIFGITVVDEDGINPASPEITSSLFVANYAYNGGAALASSGSMSHPTSTLSTFVANYGYGSGSGNALQVEVSEATVRDSIFWRNGPVETRPIVVWFPPCGLDIDYSIVEGGVGALMTHASCAVTWGGHVLESDPAFIREPNDGGDGWGDAAYTPDVDEGANDDLGDLRLQSSSPAIDAGSPTYLAQPGETDLDGTPRIRLAFVDMGCYEYFPDCDGNGILDACDLACDALEGVCQVAGCGEAQDCNSNDLPDSCDSDVDDDGIVDDCDNCPYLGNVAQSDQDGDGVGDVCDTCPAFDDRLDVDEDDVPDSCDNCPNDVNSDQADSDGDGYGNECDACPGVDDAIYAPGCELSIPTVSGWGMVVLSLLFAVFAKIYFGRWRASHHP